jgi:hypothetical protein
MVYNEDNNEIAITGGSFGNYFSPGAEDDTDASTKSSDCFVGILRLPHADPNGQKSDPSKVSWVRRRQYGGSEANEFCSDLLWKSHAEKEDSTALEFDSILPGEIITVGHTAEEGLMHTLLPPGNDHRQMYGMAMALDSEVNLQGGGLFHSNEIQLPVAITRNPMDDTLFVAEMFSDNEHDVSLLTAPATADQPKFGQDLSAKAFNPTNQNESFSVRIRMMNKQRKDDVDAAAAANETMAWDTENIQEVFKEGWVREYGTEGLENVRVTSMRFVPPDRLLLTGYTSGSSEAFGNADGNNDMDGFLAVMHAESGDVISVLRIESDSDEPGDDRIQQLCFKEGSDEYNQEITRGVYVVGTKTKAEDGSQYAFLSRVLLDNMSVRWTRKVEGFVSPNAGDDEVPRIEGLACAVTYDGRHVYMGGNVKGGSMLPERRRKLLSCQRDNDGGDVFVSKFGADGELMFTREIGSKGTDTLATGRSLTTDAEDNVIVLANTDGSLFREKDPNGSTDIVIFSIGAEFGNFVIPPDFKDECRDSHLGGKVVPGVAAQSYNPVSRWAGVVIGTLAMLSLVIFSLVGLFIQRRKAKEQIFTKGTKFSNFNSSLVQYDGIWRTAAVPSQPVVLMGRGEASKDPYFNESFSGSFSSQFTDTKPPPRDSAHKFPLGAYSDNASGAGTRDHGDVYDLLEMASRRYSRVLEEEQSASRSRLQDAIKSVTSSGSKDDDPELEDIVGDFEEEED